mmetsp:Transcript_44268/g.141032  ORF Transcript_44268/g.141032 Transcript_44268/m.141032 type:complete len:251 (-) Transcript_44268:917-1669(-)
MPSSAEPPIVSDIHGDGGHDRGRRCGGCQRLRRGARAELRLAERGPERLQSLPYSGGAGDAAGLRRPRLQRRLPHHARHRLGHEPPRLRRHLRLLPLRRDHGPRPEPGLRGPQRCRCRRRGRLRQGLPRGRVLAHGDGVHAREVGRGRHHVDDAPQGQQWQPGDRRLERRRRRHALRLQLPEPDRLRRGRHGHGGHPEDHGRGHGVLRRVRGVLALRGRHRGRHGRGEDEVHAAVEAARKRPLRGQQHPQ